MAQPREAEDNHWPGYVDALTTMTMMLIFVMTILTVVIFGLSQTASRAMVEKIARAVQLEASDPNEGAEQLASRIVARLEHPPAPSVMVAETPVAETPQRVESRATAAVDGPSPSNRVVSGGDALVIAYQRRATGLDADAKDRIRLAFADYANGSGAIELRAHAARDSAMSDARRVAFYRLLHLRSELIAMGVPADRIRARIDESAKGEPDTVLVARSG